MRDATCRDNWVRKAPPRLHSDSQARERIHGERPSVMWDVAALVYGVYDGHLDCVEILFVVRRDSG